jgi:hypothetical protein
LTGYSFQEGIPEGFSPDFEIGIFHDPQHLKLQSLSGWRTFVALNSEQRLIVALIHIHVAGSHASSPFRSPYGSFVFSQGTSDELLKRFISFVEGELKNSGVQELVLKDPPEVYREWTSMEKIFIASGYHIKSEETSSVIPVTDKSFSEKLHRTKKSRLKKGTEGELTFERLLHIQFDKMYAFIMTCRERKGERVFPQYECR